MACGTPVLTSNISSLPEVVAEAAYLVNPLNISEIEAGIEELLKNPEQYRTKASLAQNFSVGKDRLMRF